jgi:hypothetical protein
MTVPRGNKLYALACDYLWAALSTYWEFVDIAPQTFAPRYASWDIAYEALAEHLLNERGYALNVDRAMIQGSKQTLVLANTSESQLIPVWVAQVNSAAERATLAFPGLDRDFCLYRYFCCFIVQVIREYELLFQEMHEALHDFKSRHAARAELFDNLVDVFNRESRLLATHENIDDEAQRVAVRDMLAFAAQLANNWKQAVLSASSGQTR